MTTHDLLLSRVAAARWPPIALPEGMQPSVPSTASLRLHCGRRDASVVSSVIAEEHATVLRPRTRGSAASSAVARVMLHRFKTDSVVLRVTCAVALMQDRDVSVALRDRCI